MAESDWAKTVEPFLLTVENHREDKPAVVVVLPTYRPGDPCVAPHQHLEVRTAAHSLLPEHVETLVC
jgi:hypothetical protein